MIRFRPLLTTSCLPRVAIFAVALGLSALTSPVESRGQDADATLATATIAADATQPNREYLLKTAFVFNFARYTTWPPPSPDGPFFLCILGDDEFGTAARYLDGERLRERNVDVRFHAVGDDLTGCQLVYIARPLADQLDSILPRLHAKRMLTVSDIPSFAIHGGILGLKIVENRIRFEANPAVAKKAGLRLSAQLLRHADVVGDKLSQGPSG